MKHLIVLALGLSLGACQTETTATKAENAVDDPALRSGRTEALVDSQPADNTEEAEGSRKSSAGDKSDRL